jgi:trigger factor
VQALSNDELKVLFSITVKPEVKLGEYKGLTAEKDTPVVEEQEIEDQINALLAQNVTLEVVDRPIENGDTAVIDFEGFKDDVAFDGGKAEAYPLEIGSGSFIPGFEEQLVGKKAGDELDVDVTFPEEYQAPDLAGQPVVFKVKVNEVKEKSETKLDDEFAKSLSIEGVEDVASLKEDISKKILEQKQQEAEMKYTNDLVDQVLATTEIDVPQAMIDGEVEQMYAQMMQRFQMQGASEEMFLQMTGQTKEDVLAQIQPDALNKIKYTLALEEIAKVENVEVSEAEIDAEFTKMAEMYNMSVEQIKQMIPDTSGISFELKMQKAADIIKNNVK